MHQPVVSNPVLTALQLPPPSTPGWTPQAVASPWRSTPRHPPPSTRLAPAAVSSRAPTAAATGAPSAPGWTPHCCIALGIDPQTPAILYAGATRSEERRVGQEC